MKRRFWQQWSIVGALIGIWLGAAAALQAEPPAEDSAEALVCRALQAEVDGQPTVRMELLKRACAESPGYAPARWHSGQVRVGSRWLSVAGAEQRAAQDDALAAYIRLRDGSPDSAAGHMALAVLCRKNGLTDRERWHWSHVLRFQPDNADAIRALGLKKYRNAWLTEKEIEQCETMRRQFDAAKARWQPILERIARSLEGGSPDERDEALRQLRSIDAPAAIPLLEAKFANADEASQLELVGVLGRMDDQAATLSLLRFSLMPESAQVREAATDQLKLRPTFGCVPFLLTSLETPIEISYYATTLGGFSTARVALFREGLTADFSLQAVSDFTYSTTAPGEPFPTDQVQLGQRAWIRNVLAYAGRSSQAASQWNARAEAWNERVLYVLRRVTGEELDDRPQSWWKWWADYNELLVAQDKPLIERASYSRYHQRIYNGAVGRRWHPEVSSKLGKGGYLMAICSCFMPGTLVCTETGLVPIEKIRVGDRVLSQQPDSGELAYKLVIGTTVRPPSQILRIVVDGRDICTTRGHLFWRVGDGWRMAKELKAGDPLHTVSGATPIGRIEDYGTSQAHNLIVEGFATYFIEPSRLLVHDNTARQVTTPPVPGLQDL